MKIQDVFILKVLVIPKNDVPDFKKITKISHDLGLPTICDNTVLTPAIFRPIEQGWPKNRRS